MAKQEHINIRVTANLKKRLVAAAEEQGRPHTNLAAHIIRLWLDEHYPDNTLKTQLNPEGNQQ